MAAITHRRQRCVLAARMALDTSHRDVRAGKRKFRVVVIEARAAPVRGGVANLAILREARGDVIGIVRGLVFLQVAVIAGRAQGGVLPVAVALNAGSGDVRAGQRELGLRGVVKRCASPVNRGVAERAILREPRG